MADQIMTTGGTNAAIVPENWSEKFTDVLRATRPLLSTVSQTYAGDLNRGDTVRIPSLADSTAVILPEGAAADAVANTASTVSLVVDEMVALDHIVTTQAELQSISFMNHLRDGMTNAIAQKMETQLFSAIVPSASTPDHAIAYDSGTNLSRADILEAKDLLDTQNVPMQDRFMITGVAQMNDLLTVDQLINADYGNGGSGTVNGFLSSQVLGFNAAGSTNAGTTTYLGHPSFLQMVIQKSIDIKVDDLSVIGQRGFRVSASLLFGYLQLHDTRIVTIT